MRATLDDYVKRISRSSPIEITEVRDGDAAIKKLDADRAATAVLLDAAGKSLDSSALAKWLGELRDRGTRELIFLCGDADGFPDTLRQRAHQKLSLSSMTFSHELARVMLAEQLYRAFAILSGSPYPK
jgi:23S rRNA (pseudouridine1915-N3)-methyltransferase